VGERGLLGIAFDPDFKTNNYLYLYYTTTTPHLHNRISRFTLDGDVAVADSEQIILDLDKLSSAVSNHNGGGMAFGPDGELYVAVGDAGETDNGQRLGTYFGKVLRINRDGSPPADNPFPDAPSQQQKRIWAYGLRNPYTLSFQPGTGRLFINDVGLKHWEEVNDASIAGRNFGWSVTEGATTNPNYISPIYTYKHGTVVGQGCAITGGTFFNPDQTNYPAQYYGNYFVQDYCGKWIDAIDVSVTPGIRTGFASNLLANSLYVTTGPDGNLYFLNRAKGLYKLVYNQVSPATITVQPEGHNVLQWQPSSFSVSAIGSLPAKLSMAKEWSRH
jgi:glucose/arabinose dehydrogenase